MPEALSFVTNRPQVFIFKALLLSLDVLRTGHGTHYLPALRQAAGDLSRDPSLI
jgi:hypothetical protein